MSFLSTKTYNHNVGLSCCFRQWRAKDSHCQYLHGYSISVRFNFKSEENISKGGRIRPQDIEIIKTLPKSIYPKGFDIKQYINKEK